MNFCRGNTPTCDRDIAYVVECDPLADDPFGHKTICQFVQVC